MNQIKLELFGKLAPKKRRGVAEVISTLLLVVITVVGAVILTSFIDESFVSGSISVSSSTDSTIKTIKLRAYDTRDGARLMGNVELNNEHFINSNLCRVSCVGSTDNIPSNGGSEFLVLQIENRSVNPIYLKNLYLGTVNHTWDPTTNGVQLNPTGPLAGGIYPSDGRFSILPEDMSGLNPTQLDNQITGGQTVNILIKLDTTNPDIELSKTMRVQLNIGENSLAEFLIETGDTR